MSYPIFVYGTLKEGYHNYDALLKGKVEKVEEAVIEHCELLDIGFFPGLLFGEYGVGNVKGEVMYIREDIYDEVLQSVDWLEGYREGRSGKDCMYTRHLTPVKVNGELVYAWVYIWNRERNYPKIKSGEWVGTKRKARV